MGMNVLGGSKECDVLFDLEEHERRFNILYALCKKCHQDLQL